MKNEIHNPTRKATSLCWTCVRSCPIPGIGCSWSRRFRPVDGWEAEQTLLQSANGKRSITSYCVCTCPLYIEERNVQTNDFTFEEQMA